jgi:hypothetical protein
MTCIDRANFKNPSAYSSERTAAEEKTKEMHPGEMASEVLPATNNVERSTARRNSVTSAPTENLPVQLMECR